MSWILHVTIFRFHVYTEWRQHGVYCFANMDMIAEWRGLAGMLKLIDLFFRLICSNTIQRGGSAESAVSSLCKRLMPMSTPLPRSVFERIVFRHQPSLPTKFYMVQKKMAQQEREKTRGNSNITFSGYLITALHMVTDILVTTKKFLTEFYRYRHRENYTDTDYTSLPM